MQKILFNYPGLDVFTGSVFDLKFEHSELDHNGVRISGLMLGAFHLSIKPEITLTLHQITDRFLHVPKSSFALVLSCREKYIWVGQFKRFLKNTTDFTFAVGMKRFPAGRLGDNPSIGISSSLNAAGFRLGRLQTGTPARLDRNTINFSHMLSQLGDPSPSPFSFLHDNVDNAVYRVLCGNP
jgi:tRNA uridine 5-carboxymethylaminomethyl modification enzyme